MDEVVKVGRGSGKTLKLLERLVEQDQPGRVIVFGVHTSPMVHHVRYLLAKLRPHGMHARWVVREVSSHEKLRGMNVNYFAIDHAAESEPGASRLFRETMIMNRGTEVER